MENNRVNLDKDVLDAVFEIVSSEFKINKDVILLKTRNTSSIIPRQVCQLILRRHTRMSLSLIGEYTGGYKHCSVINNAKSIENLCFSDSEMRKTVTKIENAFKLFLLRSKKHEDSNLSFVLIESPYRSNSAKVLFGNMEYAKSALLDSIKRGETPFASHLLYTQVLDEDSDERYEGINLALNWLFKVDFVAVYCDRGITEGMEMSINKANALGIRVEYRNIL